MSRQKFEGLINDLAVLLLNVDFGTASSLAESHARIEAVIHFLELSQRLDLVLPARSVIEALHLEAENKDASNLSRDRIADQLGQLAKFWSDQAKHWSTHPQSSDHRLQLTELADSVLLGEFIANARLAAEDLQTHIEEICCGSAEAVSAVRRIIHTIKGEAGMLGLDALARVLHETETYLERLSPTWEGAEPLQLVRDWMPEALSSYARGLLPAIPAGLLDGLAQPSVGTDGGENLSPCEDSATAATSDDTSTVWDEEELELVAEFLHESHEATGSIDQTLLEIEHGGADSERVNKLFRTFHSLKGVASFLRMQQIVDLTHTTETMLDRVRSGKLSTATGLIDLVFDSTTLLRSLLIAVETAAATSTPLAHVPGVHQLIDRIETTTRGEIPQGSLLPATPGSRIGEILLQSGAVSESQLSRALATQQASGQKLGEVLINEGVVPAKIVAQALRGQTNAIVQASKTKELVKVDLERVDSLVETIGELVIVESMVSNAPEVRALPAHLRSYLSQFAKITRELQELGMSMRMVPLRSEFQKMARMVRDLTRRSNKRVRVELRGEQTEMDRSMVEQISDPLVHLIRNAVDHGVESPAERMASGKAETATIVLSATHEGSSIVIEISDDGRGINRDAVLAKAISQGLIGNGAVLSDGQVHDLLFVPGFSTAAQVTEISGRGVGMDVVKRNIETIRGRITTQSSKGRGTTFRLVLPLTLAIIDGMVIRTGNERFIVPTLCIVESLKPSREMLFSMTGSREHILVRGQSLPLIRLGDLLDVDGPEQEPTKALVIIVESVHSRVALLVDEVVMKHQVVIKTLGIELGVNQMFAGAAILSNGRVGLILNVESLVETALAQSATRLKTVA